jgi:hypothetical protein
MAINMPKMDIVDTTDPMTQFLTTYIEGQTVQAYMIKSLEERLVALEHKVESQQEALDALPSTCLWLLETSRNQAPLTRLQPCSQGL